MNQNVNFSIEHFNVCVTIYIKYKIKILTWNTPSVSTLLIY